jgi:hypothetical protein
VVKVLILAMSLVILAVPPTQEYVTLTSSADFEWGNNEGLISTAQDRLTRGRITAGDVGDWSSTSAIPSGRVSSDAVAFNGYVYVTGGRGVGAYYHSYSQQNVYVASLNADGSLGPWSSTTHFMGGKQEHRSVAYNGYLYVMGGVDIVFLKPGDVQVARIQEDGSVGAWSATTPLPSPPSAFAAVAYDNHLYAIGGVNHYTAAKLADVWVAPIHADGTLGEWSASTSLPTATIHHDAVAYNGFLYVAGGDDESSGDLSRVLMAPINGDGSIGSWSATTSLPSGRSSHEAVACDGFLYCIGGGAPNGDPLGDVLVAPIHGDGSIGEWSASTAISPARKGASSVAHGGFLYTIGGSMQGQGYLTEVLVAPILADAANAHQSPDRLRGFHSRLVDMQGDTSSRFITINGQLSPGGAIRLQVRVAPEATQVLGAETVFDSVSPGSTIEVPGDGRYVWLRLTLDDTGTTDVDQPTHVSDVTISLEVPPPGGFVLDGRTSDDDNDSCSAGASAIPGSALALLAGLVLLASAWRRVKTHPRKTH